MFKRFIFCMGGAKTIRLGIHGYLVVERCVQMGLKVIFGETHFLLELYYGSVCLGY